MEINWPEILVGGLIFFAVGVVFTLFVQPALERQRDRRREQKTARREAQDAEIAAEITRLAANPNLFAARYREGVLRVIGLVISAVIIALGGLVLDSVPFTYIISFVPYAIAFLLVVPAASAVSRLQTLASGVRRELEANSEEAPVAES